LLSPGPGRIGRRALCLGLLATPLVGRAASPILPAPGALDVPGVRPRSDWSALPPLAGGRPHVAAHFALHHTAGPVADTAAAPAVLRGIQAFHMHEKGWVDLAYHVFVDSEGVAWEGRSPDLAGDTATTYDPAGWFLVCALGNFEEVQPSPALIEGIATVLARVSAARGIPLDHLTAHRELAATACPGAHLASRVQDGSLLARAKVIASAG